jgi:CRISPR-associated protein Cas2
MMGGDLNESCLEDAFANQATVSEQRGHPCGAHEMLVIIAYDIRNPRRLARVARFCENYSIRVQYSVFECKLPLVEFDDFWQHLKKQVNLDEDRLVAYRICAECAKDVRSAGTMDTTSNKEKQAAFIF